MESYPKIYALGHRYVRDIFNGDVTITEKVDGSQFSFGRIDGELEVRSRRQKLTLEAPEGMFLAGVTSVMQLDLHNEWVYRGEYLKSPRHNALTYDRTPKGHVAIFDIQVGMETYLDYDAMTEEANRLGVDVVPLIHKGPISDQDSLMELLDRESFLGGPKIEGIVIKNYEQFGPDGKVVMAKLVSEAFKEVNNSNWKEQNPTNTDIIQTLICAYRSEPRWQKSVQHLRDEGKLNDEPKDIGLLVKAIPEDILEECSDQIKDALFAWAWPKIKRGAMAGMAEWYKEQLVAKQFEGEA